LVQRKRKEDIRSLLADLEAEQWAGKYKDLLILLVKIVSVGGITFE
jgi:hypothetical protein